jgi:hypothetical protein
MVDEVKPLERGGNHRWKVNLLYSMKSPNELTPERTEKKTFWNRD